MARCFVRRRVSWEWCSVLILRLGNELVRKTAFRSFWFFFATRWSGTKRENRANFSCKFFMLCINLFIFTIFFLGFFFRNGKMQSGGPSLNPFKPRPYIPFPFPALSRIRFLIFAKSPKAHCPDLDPLFLEAGSRWCFLPSKTIGLIYHMTRLPIS